MLDMPDLLRGLATFDLTAYSDETHRLGRGQLARDSELVRQISLLAAASQAVADSGKVELDRPAYDMVQLSRLFLDAQHYILSHDRPRYEPYASTLLLRYVLGTDSHAALSATQDRIWVTFCQILDEQLAFEKESLLGSQYPPKQHFTPHVARARCAALREIQQSVPARYRFAPRWHVNGSRWLLPVVQDRPGPSAVARLLVFPQTNYHDEVAFLRSIHLSECLFWGALLCVRRALASFHAGRLDQTAILTAAADEFAAPLIKIFQAVREMPPENFRDFRDATGDASAIQSQSWQLLDAHMYGVLPEKVSALNGTPEVRHVLRLANRHFSPLVDVVRELDDSALHASLCDRIIELDHHLRAWRKFHEKQLAGRPDPGYLPPCAPGTGGTSGYGYLASHKPPRPARRQEAH